MNNLNLLSDLVTGNSNSKTDLWAWGTITSVSPLKVKLDGETAELAATADSLYANPAVNQRVWVQLSGRRIIIHGAASGGTNTAGVIEMFGGTLANIPTGYLACDGVVRNISDYPLLGARLGSLHGGNGTTTFATPNMLGRSPIGYNANETEFNAVGKSGGAKTHVLSINEMPWHDHGTWAGRGYVNFVRVVGAAGTGRLKNHTTGYASAGYVDMYETYEAPAMDHTHQIYGQGGGAAHNNLHPYVAVPFIIRTF